MSKYFKNSSEFDEWLKKYAERLRAGKTLEEYLLQPGPSEEDCINALISAGYTDLDNLVIDGHAYELGGHKNNGWLYRDEIDFNYCPDFPKERIRERVK